MSSSDDCHDEEAPGTQPQLGKEPLACVTCRARKLKCDRSRPACVRCTKVNSECVYPESRRKPTFKRRNVKELEARLAQVETLLKGVSETTKENPSLDQSAPPRLSPDIEAAFSLPSHGTAETVSDDLGPPSQVPFAPDFRPVANSTTVGAEDWQLMGLGLSEAPPPWEVIEELTENYFNTSHSFVPIVHPGRYRQAMYGGPYMQPPMCLQYIIWAMSAQNLAKYNAYEDIFYKRARLYFERDEMKGDGECFVSLQHAQTLALLASYEAKCMLFTRAALNMSKCVRLVQMLGLEKLDSKDLAHPHPIRYVGKSWVEKEEMRRAFWGAYAIDAHTTVSTGWPSLLAGCEIRTRLPSSEDAFISGREETAPFLDEVFEGAEYSSFSSTLVACHVFKTILRHVHRPEATDRPQDVQGPFWERHRGFDNMLVSLLMFLPPQLKLHHNKKCLASIYINLNLHASVICLHHAAIEQAEKHNLSPSIKQASVARMRSSAMEIAHISRLAADMAPMFKSPLCALSLYTAATVYVYLGKQDPVSGLGAVERSNFEVILRFLEAIGNIHEVTNAFFQQICADIERNGLDHVFQKSGASQERGRDFADSRVRSIATAHNPGWQDRDYAVPFATFTQDKSKSAGLKRSKPGRADVQQAAMKQSGRFEKMAAVLDGECFQTVLGAVERNMHAVSETRILGTTENNNNKRRRMSPSPGPNFNLNQYLQGSILMPRSAGQDFSFSVPDRTGSSSSSSPAYRGAGTDTQLSGSSHTSPSMLGLGNTAEENRVDLRQLQGRVAAPQWDGTEPFFFGEVTDEMVNEALGQANGEPWNFLTADIPWPGQSGGNE